MRLRSGCLEAGHGMAFHCNVCDTELPPGKQHGHRRRDPWGLGFYCRKHGELIQSRALAALRKDPLLAQFCHIHPGFLFYTDPALISIKCDPPPSYPAPVAPYIKARGPPSPTCSKCGVLITEAPPGRRLGAETCCGPCGRRWRRARARRLASDAALRAMAASDERVYDYVRGEVREWLARSKISSSV